jgi:hypothetical protein
LKPTRSSEILERRYDVVEFFLDLNQHELLRVLREHLKLLTNMPVKSKQTNYSFLLMLMMFCQQWQIYIAFLGITSTNIRSKCQSLILEAIYRCKSTGNIDDCQ